MLKSFHVIRLAVVALIAFSFSLAESRGVDTPEDRWLHAYVLVQTGHDLAERELWPLATANYAAALEQFENLAEDFPGYQPRLVDYRRNDLKERIQHANESMNAGEHDVAMLYEDIIETSRIGTKSRYELEYETSYQYLVNAQWQMEELLEDGAPAMVEALAKQKRFIDEMTEASRESLMRMQDGPIKVHNIERDFAEKVSIAMSDLPSFQEISPAESGMTSALFPDELIVRVRGEWYR